ncbi:MAG: lipid-binding SYLF domain-containing protein [Planctomycetia bacterium]|nr:lipid-binding SYLF domain-containing protein [Planctomycetia bacterium]
MRRRSFLTGVTASVTGLAVAVPITGRTAPQLIGGGQKEATTVRDATVVLEEIMKIPASSIPEALFREAYGLVIVPGMIKVGFIGSFQRGQGVLLVRDPVSNQWQQPIFVTLTGAGAGFQAGVQSMDVVLVLRTQKSVESITTRDRQFTLGVDAAAAAGPVGRQASLSTDIQLKSEILSYSRTRGLFAGASIDGTVLDTDTDAGRRFYAETPAGAKMPEVAQRLVETIRQYSGAMPDLETIRQDLAGASVRLQSLLDAQWKTFLALPPETETSGSHPSVDVLREVVKKYDTVAADTQYYNLTSRREFTDVRTLLGQYLTTLERASSATGTPDSRGILPEQATSGTAIPAPPTGEDSGGLRPPVPAEPAFPEPGK